MPRARGKVAARRRHKKILKLAKGHRGSRHKLFRQANESVMHALQYQYEHRRRKKGEFRRLWIQRINAAARLNGMSYSQLINGLTRAKVEVDRKVLADLAVRDAPTFAKIVETAKGALAA
jgi:large subunit ribosomal protein L20